MLSLQLEVVVYFHEFHQKPATLDGDGIVINQYGTLNVGAMAVTLGRVWVVQSNYINVSSSTPQEAHMTYGNMDGEESRKGCKHERKLC